MAVGDITINWARRRLPNSRFSAPYMTVGLQVLGRSITSTPILNLRFLDAFTTGLWILIIANLIFLTFALLFVESSAFRAQFGYFKAESQGHSWEDQASARSYIRLKDALSIF